MVVCVRCGLVGCDCEERARVVLVEFMGEMDKLPLGRVSRVRVVGVGDDPESSGGVGDTDME